MSPGTDFFELAQLCEQLRSTTKRNVKSQLIADLLHRLNEEEIAPAILLTIGSIFPERAEKALDIGFQTISKITSERKQTTLVQEPLTILDVNRYFSEIAEASGPGSVEAKESLLQSMLGRATDQEAKWIMQMIFGEMQHGVNQGVMIEAIARAAEVDAKLVREANMFTGDLGKVGRVALKSGLKGLQTIGIKLFTPIKPMLAEMSYDIAEVIAEHGGKTALEFKFDGARIQIHKKGDEVRIFTRRLSEVTESLPEIVQLARTKVAANEAILDGEVVAVGADGRPLPFQDLMRRFKRIKEVEEAAEQIPVQLHLFDLIYIDGQPLTQKTYEERWNLLTHIIPKELLAERIITGSQPEAETFLKRALDAGHEGLMAKALNSDYAPGKRGKKWFKIKPAEQLDLAIIAADWGYGRRTGWLSNYHLGALDPETGSFEMVGKTFKGLTDQEFEEMTRRLQTIKTRETRYTVYVKPQVVVEVAFNEIQRSPHYRSGFALRFARITRIRDDKSPSEADTIQRMRELYEKQFQRKAKANI